MIRKVALGGQAAWTLVLRLALLMGWLSLSGSFLGLAAAVRTLLLGLVVGMDLLVVVPALPAEEEQNLLSVATHSTTIHYQVRVAKMPVF